MLVLVRQRDASGIPISYAVARLPIRDLRARRCGPGGTAMDVHHAEAPWPALLSGLQNPKTQANPANKKVFRLTRLFLDVGLKMFDDSVVDSGGGTTFGRREVTR